MPDTGSETLPGRQSHSRLSSESELSALRVGTYFFRGRIFNEAASALLGPLPLQQPSKSKPITPCAVVNGLRARTQDSRSVLVFLGYWFNTPGANHIPGTHATA